MAGNLAIQKQSLSAIGNVSELYDAYYRKYVDSTLGEDRDLCFTLGVLAVINAVILDDMSILQELLDNYGITSDEFKNKIHQLSRLEVVEIHLDQIATLADQCLANYMLYYVFFQKKIIPFSSILEIGYKHFRTSVIRTINTILNLFYSEETKIYCKQEILKVWDKLKNVKHPDYERFVRDFHIFRPEEAFVMAQEKIENINSEEFEVYNIDFSIPSTFQNESVLTLLTDYQNSDYLDVVMELLLNYSERTSKTMVSGCQWLESYYGVSVTEYKYSAQKQISKYLFKAASEENVVAMAMGFQWAKYSLAFLFRSTEAGRKNTFVL